MATILIVEDDAPTRMALEGVLVEAGHTVVAAPDGVEALARLRAGGGIELVFADLMMPRMDGYELVREMRGDPMHARTPVVLWTATYDSPEAQRLALECGASQLLSKPSDPALIRAAVIEALAHQRNHLKELGSDFDRAHVRLLSQKLDMKIRQLGGRRADPLMRPILVVEDNPMDLDFLLQAFEESKVLNPVRVCRDGEETLQFISAHAEPRDPELPLLVLLDLRLPKVDGVEVLKQAREHPVWKRIPFIVVTTSRENADISRAYELGVNSYIVKPVDFASFAEVVKNIKVYWLLTNEPPFPSATEKQR